jgi:pyruvate kinase
MEAGSDNETRQLLIVLFRELKKDINDVKTDVKMDIRAVAIGQVDLKNDISAVKDEINTGQENTMFSVIYYFYKVSLHR